MEKLALLTLKHNLATWKSDQKPTNHFCHVFLYQSHRQIHRHYILLAERMQSHCSYNVILFPETAASCGTRSLGFTDLGNKYLLYKVLCGVLEKIIQG